MDIVDGMKYLHDEHDSIHRDLKSANILLSKDERDDLIRGKVADFGMSKLVSQEALNQRDDHNKEAMSSLQSSNDSEEKTRKPSDALFVPSSMMMTLTSGCGTYVVRVSVCVCVCVFIIIIIIIIIIISLSLCLSRITKEEKEGTTRTATIKRSNTHTHSPTHMAPEIWSELQDNKAHLTKKIDVYSFAVIMWETLTLKKPWADVKFTYKIGKSLLKGDRLKFESGDGKYEDSDQLDPPDNYIKLMQMCWAKVDERPDFTYVRNEMKSWETYLKLTRKMSMKKKKEGGD